MDELVGILNRMDIPESRKELTEWNVRWLLRNLGINNRSHPEFKQAIGLLAKKSRELSRNS